MSNFRAIPDPVIVPLQREDRSFSTHKSIAAVIERINQPSDIRLLRVEEFLMARSLSPKTQKDYRIDLKHFLNWTDKGWAEVTPRLVAQFKAHLTRLDDETNQRVLKDASVRRILGTLKNFYGWLFRNGYVNSNPTGEVDLPKLTEPEAQNLSQQQVEQIYEAVANSSLAERNTALISVLLHGLRAQEVSALDLEDYNGKRLHIREAKADSKGFVPLSPLGKADLDAYLEWRQQQLGEVLHPTSPLFVSHSRRNSGDRLGYEGIRKVTEAISTQINQKFHAHQCRHTFATELVLQGMNPYHVMTITRHRSTSSFRRYTKAADQAAAEAAFYQTLNHNKG